MKPALWPQISRFAVVSAALLLITSASAKIGIEKATADMPRPQFASTFRATPEQVNFYQTTYFDCVINPDGRVVSAKIKRSSGSLLLDQKRVALLKEIQFTPKVVEGKAVSQRIQLRMNAGE